MGVPAGAALPTRAARGGREAPQRPPGGGDASAGPLRAGQVAARHSALPSGPPAPRVAEVLRYLIAGGGGEHFVAFVVVTVTQRAPPSVWSQKQGC